jgi:hypothetical protein
MRTAAVALFAAGSAILAASVSSADAAGGRSVSTALGPSKVTVVRASFPVSDYPGGQWVTTSNAWVTSPGAAVKITVPTGEKALIIVRFSPAVICEGAGVCESRVVINGTPAEPDKAISFNAGSTSHWGVLYTERSLGPLSPGTYTVSGQVQTTYGLSGTTLYMRSFHMTIERFSM